MKIFNISHLFQSPVVSSTNTTSQSKRSKRRRRKRRTQSDECVQHASDSLKFCQNASVSSDQRLQPSVVVANNTKVGELPKLKKVPEKTAANQFVAAKPKSAGSPKKGLQTSKTVPVSRCDSARTKVTENMKQEMMDLIHSLQTLTSEKDILEKSLNELREENDRLMRSNEDLKDELKEMTDEALELTVEKQRLLSKIGVLKKQLLNRPK